MLISLFFSLFFNCTVTEKPEFISLENIEVVETICEILEDLKPNKLNSIKRYKDLITYVDDRSGHDRRYAIDNTKISNELNWKPNETFQSGIKKTISWYLKNKDSFKN